MAPALIETGLLTSNGDSSAKTGSVTTGDAFKVSVNKQKSSWTPRSDDDFAVLTVRNLVLDICMQNGGGHGGSALGMAAIGVALWKYVMRYNPQDPEWFDRDRFVLSNGKKFAPSQQQLLKLMLET